MQAPTARGIRPGGLHASRWADDRGPSAWSSRGNSAYIPRRSGISSAINPVAPQPPPQAANGNWWENTPAPVLRGSAKPPPVATPTPGRRDFATSQQELRRYVQIVRRMKWKLPYLVDGYSRAVGMARDPEGERWAKENPQAWETERQEAELHFKLDFFEFYMLLERALVHLLGVFKITVSRQPMHNGNGAGNSNHSYHHNVLVALERPQNPLYNAMGTGRVRQCLGQAKDLRNRWKHAEHPMPDGTMSPGYTPLTDYNLTEIMDTIFDGFDEGYTIAERWVADLAEDADMVLNDDVASGGEQPSAVERVTEDFGFIVDAMDWEAV